MIIREARDTDIAAITGIFNEWIPTRTITWREELATLEERSAWLDRQRDAGYPTIVAEEEGEVLGYASYGSFRGEGKWPGYRQTVEHTVHVRSGHWRRGIGRALVEALIERARAAGIHVMIGAIDGDNLDSIRFHERLGFVVVGRLPQTGQKFGRWLDLVLMQRVLDSRDRP